MIIKQLTNSTKIPLAWFPSSSPLVSFGPLSQFCTSDASFFSHHIEKLKHRATAAESIPELTSIFTPQLPKLKTSSPQSDKIFAIMCRNYARTIRKSKHLNNFNIRALLGQQYQVIDAINLQSLTFQQLQDVVSFLNIVIVKAFMDPNDKKLSQFVENLLQLMLINLKKDKKINISYLTKAIRCAQAFQSNLYQDLLILLSNSQIQQMQPFDFIALLNCCIRGKNNSKTSQNQLAFIQKSLQRTIKNNWIDTASIHSFLDVINSVRENDQIVGVSKKINQLLFIAKEQVSDKLLKQYKSMTGEEIIRVIKFLIKDKNRFACCQKIVHKVLNSVKENGQSPIDPIFSIRLILFVRTERLNEIYPKWQQKMMKMIKFYFVNHRINCRPIFDGLQLIVDHGCLTHQRLFELLKYLKVMLQQIDKTDQARNKFVKNMTLLQIYTKYSLFDEVQEILLKIISMKEKHQKQFVFPFYNYFIYFQATFLKQLGYDKAYKKVQELCVIQPKKSLFGGNKKSGSQSQNKGGDPSQLLNDIIKIQSNNKKSFGENQKLFSIFFEKIVPFVKFYQNYPTIINLLESIYLSKTQVEVVLQGFLKLSIPQRHQQMIINYFLKNLNEIESVAYFCFNHMRESRNTDMKHSQNQAKLFMKVCQNLPSDTKFLFYSDNQILTFLTTYAPQDLLNELCEWTQNSSVSPQNYEFILIRMLYILSERSSNRKIMKKIYEKSMQKQMSSQIMFNYFSNIVISSYIATKDELETRGNYKVGKEKIKGKLNKNKDDSHDIKEIKEDTPHQQTVYFKQMSKVLSLESVNKKNIKNIHKLVELVREQILSNKANYYIIVRDIIMLVNFVNEKKQKITDNQIKQMFLTLLVDATLKLNHYNFWVFHALDLANKMEWIVPEIYDKGLQVASSQLFWKSYFPPKQIIRILIQYPSNSKQNENFIRILTRILEVSPDSIKIVKQYANKIDDYEIYPENIEKYLEYFSKKHDN